MRKNIVVANWKMNLDRSNAISLAQEVLSNKADNSSVEVVFAPSFLYIYKIAKLCMINENFSVAAQDCSLEEQGAFTGEVSASMLASCNATKVIIGHSERRIKFKESNEELKNKVLQAYGNALDVIFCCGESLEQRDKGLHFDWIKSQISESIFFLTEKQVLNLTVAYEPIWAIGTGKTASVSQAQEMHAFIRSLFSDRYGEEIGNQINILYGGSCNPSNAEDLFNQRDIDGGLIGGASLQADNFLSIINSF